jgi:hypothetical protein
MGILPRCVLGFQIVSRMMPCVDVMLLIDGKRLFRVRSWSQSERRSQRFRFSKPDCGVCSSTGASSSSRRSCRIFRRPHFVAPSQATTASTRSSCAPPRPGPVHALRPTGLPGEPARQRRVALDLSARFGPFEISQVPQWLQVLAMSPAVGTASSSVGSSPKGMP